ncbi:hypothetical protein PM082_011826 [Marasmius tenuissimus]|nr:hypothetical protein PM082_011826 [Marasmius tenuissimus]
MVMQNTYAGPGQQNNAITQNISYGGGQMIVGEVNNFMKNFDTTGSKPHKSLWDAIAGVGASHKAEQQFSRGECLEGTRVKALGMIHGWRSAKHQPLPLCWLSGPAGVGKTAIAMTVAKSAEENGLVTSFFFFRSDPRRNNPSALVPSIAHGLKMVNTSLKDAIEKRISDNPTILEERLEEQFQELVVKPCTPKRQWWDCIRRIWEAIRGNWAMSGASKEPAVVIIDGLDECGDDRTQLRVLSAIVSSYQQNPSFPLRFLICSRPESWIKDAFCQTPLSRFTKHILLDESFLPSRDIERYYLHAFDEIRGRPENTRIEFSDPWPSEADLECLVRKSSGQFVYATVAAKFIGLPCSDPIEQLHHILSYTPDNHSDASSFSELDLLYHIILSVSPNHRELLSILAAVFILPPHAPPSPQFIELLLELPTGGADRILRYMHSVLNISTGNVAVTPYHTSFTEFLYDPSRSGQFYIDRAAFHESLVAQWLRTLTRQVKTNPNIILRPDPTSAVHCLLEGWVTFCVGTDEMLTKRLLIETDNLLRTILSAYPDRQQLDLALTLLFWLPDHTYSSGQVQTFGELILGDGVSLVTEFLKTCQLVARSDKVVLEPFFRTILHTRDPSQVWYTDILKHHDFLAQRWIKALVPNNQPISRTECDQMPPLLWAGWADFCCGIQRPSDELLSDLENLDLMRVAFSMALVHSEHENFLFMVVRPLETVISWLTPVDGLIPIRVIQHFEEALDSLKYHLSDEQRTPNHQARSPYYQLDCLYNSLLKSADPDHDKVCCILAAILILPGHLEPSPACIELLLGVSSKEVDLTLYSMRSLLDICGPEHGLHVYHTSFRDYLVDKSRSQNFHIDLTTERLVIVHLWLQNLSTERVRACR